MEQDHNFTDQSSALEHLHEWLLKLALCVFCRYHLDKLPPKPETRFIVSGGTSKKMDSKTLHRLSLKMDNYLSALS